MLRFLSTCYRSHLSYFRIARVLLFAAVIALKLRTGCLAAPSDGFITLKEGYCKPVPQNLVSILPREWNRYLCCAKLCSVKENDAAAPSLFVVSIWIQQFYTVMSPQTPETAETFPLPMILDKSFRMIGELPEVFPLNDVTSPKISFGRWSEGMPREIRIDVSSPAVEGDYFYPPMQWDEKKGRYVMRGKGVTYGQRHSTSRILQPFMRPE